MLVGGSVSHTVPLDSGTINCTAWTGPNLIYLYHCLIGHHYFVTGNKQLPLCVKAWFHGNLLGIVCIFFIVP